MGSTTERGERTAVGRLKGTRYSMFYYYLVMIRPMDQETTCIKKIAVILIDPKRRSYNTPWMRGAHGEELGWLGDRGRGGTVGKCPYCGLHLKSRFMGQLFTISRNWLTLGRAVPPESARPQMSNHLNQKNKNHG